MIHFSKPKSDYWNITLRPLLNRTGAYPERNDTPDCAGNEAPLSATDYRALLVKVLGLKPGAADIAIEQEFCSQRPGTKIGRGVDRSRLGFRSALVDLLGVPTDAKDQDIEEAAKDGGIVPPPMVCKNRVQIQTGVVASIRNRTGMSFEQAFMTARIKRPVLFSC